MVAAAWCGVAAAAEPTPSQLLEKGIYTEETVGDLDKAGGVDPGILDTLALAQHLTGDTPAAIESEKKALSLLPADAPGRDDYEATLAKFEAALEDESK